MDEALEGLLGTQLLLESAATDTALSSELQDRLLDLGYAAIAVPEVHGGLELPWRQVARLAAVGGRRLFPSALRGEAFLLAPTLAALAADGDARASADLEALLTGTVHGGAAVFQARAGLSVAYLPTEVQLLACIDGDRVVLASPEAGHVTLEPVAGLDPGQGATVIRRGESWEQARSVGGAAAAALRDRWSLVLFSEAFGGSQRCLELACEYASEREQFGSPIVAFQAVSHKLAKMAVELEAADAGIGRFVDFLESGRASGQLRLALCSYVPASARRVCEGSIQVHGGAGFTWELGLHLYYRRVLGIEQDLGGGSGSAQLAGGDYLDAIAGDEHG
jgi:alkylation response protein AidB-like acyl-CoA dehydrogenase